MEGNEMAMTQEDLQSWISETVQNMGVIPPDVLEQCNLLQPLLEKWKKQADRLLELSNSVAAYEAIVKEQYAFLGWEDTDDDEDVIETRMSSKSSHRDEEDVIEMISSESSHDEEDVIEMRLSSKSSRHDEEDVIKMQMPSKSSHHENHATKIKSSSAGISPSSPCDSEVDVCGSPSRRCTPIPNGNLNDSDGLVKVSLTRQAKVVLTRLPECELQASRRQSPEDCSSNDEHSSLVESQSDHRINDSDYVVERSSNSDSELNDSTNDSDYSVAPSPNKRRRFNVKWPVKSHARQTSQSSVDTKTKVAKKSSCKTSPITKDTVSNTKTVDMQKSSCNSKSKDNDTGSKTKSVDTQKSARKSKSTENDTGSKTKTLNKQKSSCKPKSTESAIVSNTKLVDSQISLCKTNSTEKDTVSETLEPVPDNRKVETVCVISTCCQSPEGSCKVPTKVPKTKIEVNLKVLAKMKSMCWLPGKVVGIIKMDDRLKYKIQFDNDTKCLISSHHIAFRVTSKLEYLYVGARVVVGRSEDEVFRPGIVAELPSRKNQQRFLVFIDDQTPVYVGLPHLHLVCIPLEDPMDDITNTSHRDFVKEYIKVWPYPPLAQCKNGQSLNVELDGVQQICVVLLVDCSLMQVLFVGSQRKEWIYRGSWRLEYMAKMKDFMFLDNGSHVT
ncbi:histone-lysine N-methyltransferase SETDB1-A [Phyllopteryx taeniolatus]|uniref:histone-lysine N-methyltransferase SETDB1-A n=1 Tax=Phyllopteryx taeniolatus TaxID=161469 RepID=UPI002AD2B584|nr:histone-lysine N-methyltransferase SETDB1-A [Phyllopteryx taeniolatus]XP_061616313.1 histone-lysine N-methyltransferase SETDB1-A [Phyllopteryx taeniolatus]